MAGAEVNQDEGEDGITEVEQEEKNNEGSTSVPTSASNPFISWFYITLTITVVTGVLSILYPLFATNNPKSWFLTLPPALHDHYSNGTFIKTFVSPTHPPTKVFVVDHGPKSAEPILLVHGLGSSSFSFRNILQILGSNGFRAVAVDLPGSGFSDLLEEDDKSFVWGLNWAVKIWRDVKEKGLFWGFDQLVEMGYVPYEEREEESSRVRVSGKIAGGGELGRIIGEVIESLRLSPVHLVAHDSSIGLVASWVSSNPKLVSSVTFVDSASDSSAFPYWLLGIPIVREVVLGSKWVFGSIINICCSKEVEMPAAEAYRVMLKRKGVRSAVVATGKGLLNYSFEFGDWAGSDTVNNIPLQVLWSHMTSDRWIEEGKRVVASVPRAKFVPHLGGRWPQEGASEEIAGRLIEFVSSLPRSSRKVDEESPPEQRQHMINKADHGHEYAGGYADAYGLDHAWGS